MDLLPRPFRHVLPLLKSDYITTAIFSYTVFSHELRLILLISKNAGLFSIRRKA
jgi:hypothetical protein